MPYYTKSEDWLHQSALLLEARPATTRITTRYHLKPARRLPKPKQPSSSDPSQPSQPPQPQPDSSASSSQPTPTRGHLVLKTFDPSTGVTLKYKTSKAAEVSRLVQMLGTLGRRMAGVPVTVGDGAGAGTGGDEVMLDVAAWGGPSGDVGESGSGAVTPAVGGGKEPQQQQPQQGGGGGGKGKKKKGKK
ncbi:signal recognition particle 9 kDa protein-domain-containing protein [Chaetomium sp. MPI-SDFR-AT-0129]|nr:signal recognition particle 9 kDa protein-domain-containing protein [Chaetomium sp. MPI-SDFR-AT-0129]